MADEPEAAPVEEPGSPVDAAPEPAPEPVAAPAEAAAKAEPVAYAVMTVSFKQANLLDGQVVSGGQAPIESMLLAGYARAATPEEVERAGTLIHPLEP